MDGRIITLELRNDCNELVLTIKIPRKVIWHENLVRNDWDYAAELITFLRNNVKPNEDTTSVTIRFK